MAEEIYFKSREEFRKWLSAMDLESKGVWIIFEKNKEIKFTANDALEEALCFGWIDGLIKKIDENTYKKYFSPRKKGSSWSDKNKEIINKLIENNKISSNGLLVIERAKKDGSWELKDERNLSTVKYEIFENVIKVNSRAYENYKKMPQSIKKQFVGLYNEPKKEETRVKKLKELIDLLEKNIKPMDKYVKK